MKLHKDRILSIAGLGLLTGISVSALQGCDGDGPGIPGCDITCPAEGIAEGNAAISGIAEVDAFFGAVVDVSAAANGISGALQAELDAIALSVGLEPGAAAADIRAAVEAKIGDAVAEGSLNINYQEPRCEASVDVAIAAAAECDAEVDPGSATVECSGGCEVQGGVMASCEGDATLTCTGTAPNFACEGSCEGSCELEVAAGCEGTCRGTCNGTCSVVDAQGNCAGACEGECQGTCELEAGGSCSGMCTGSCTYEPGDVGCEADATAKCEASADASVQCEGRCEGEVEPPEVKAECQASVDAKANASIECTPPQLAVTWQWRAELEGDLMAQAEFKAWLQGFKGHIGVMLAAKAKADILIESLDTLGTAGVDALQGATGLVADADIVGAFKFSTCALPELPAAVTVVGDAAAGLSASAQGSIEVFAAIGI